jgi:hypothetical protein
VLAEQALSAHPQLSHSQAPPQQAQGGLAWALAVAGTAGTPSMATRAKALIM